MTGRIHVMPPDLALKIAAGEVVERPASAVKELIDNAVDAGASRIRVELRESGLKLIRVSDDGCGITREDLPVAFASHATSKIGSAHDLERLTTLGFRGEALPSMAAVARVDVQTLASGEAEGSRYSVHFSEPGVVAPVAAPPGTRVTLTDLFANVPARRRFVRSLRAEAGQVLSVVTQYALAQPGIRFSLEMDRKQTFVSPGTGSLSDALAAVYGPPVAEDMLPVEHEEASIVVRGLTSRPKLNRQNRSAIHLVANGRPISNRSLGYALEEAYAGFLMTGRHPVAVVHIHVAPSEIDANIHPAKLQVRFARERDVHGAVHRAVSGALLGMRLESRGVHGFSDVIDTGDATDARQEVVTLLEGESALTAPLPIPDTPALRVFGQSNRTFIIAEGPNGLYMIDQHAAHERILFDRLEEEMRVGGVSSQPLLDPAAVELTPGQMEALDANRELLDALGFSLEAFGKGSCLVRAIPAVAARSSPIELVRELLTDLETVPRASAAPERTLATTACKAAVKAGQVLDLQEMRELVVQLERTARPSTCPHGRPTMIHLSHVQLEREFGRR